jgi:phosphate uptake regulator
MQVFREFIEALRKRPLLDQMYAEMEQMLTQAVEMFRPVSEVLRGKRELTKETHDEVYAMDRKINRIQRRIRKQLVEHLIVSPGTDVPISLVLMSIAKDAERVGDLCKNILEVTEELVHPLRHGPYGTRFRDLLKRTEDLFEPTVRAFLESDCDVGQDAIVTGRALAKESDQIIMDLLEDDRPCREAVLYALLARYLKRIALHLTNVASSVVMPLHMIDYYDDEGQAREEQKPESAEPTS